MTKLQKQQNPVQIPEGCDLQQPSTQTRPWQGCIRHSGLDHCITASWLRESGESDVLPCATLGEDPSAGLGMQDTWHMVSPVHACDYEGGWGYTGLGFIILDEGRQGRCVKDIIWIGRTRQIRNSTL
ncbi:hypothetical protein PCH_Pc21g11990 [Penicillium rubens Wisconsin 54-1255]|uniref:Uncharacterized protein n=1 Tax=Penicillium rubens (strain ATCC 28089 / DSM 1075 / NRRL 1951 / Wisconsin 54-1255) TaxID=500485 RepID=B6HKX0_PENRW|nr:hypothetical protein PCH_Pc21g11990 [Penicillium rubens Wisconsin 54-1255]